MQVVIARRGHELVRGRRHRPAMPSEAVHRHVDSTKLDDDVRASRELGDMLLPLLEYLGAMAFVGTYPERPAEVIENDRRFGERFRETNHHRHLRMVLPRLEAETQLAQPREAFTKLRGLVQIRRRPGVRVPPVGTRVEAAGVPDST